VLIALTDETITKLCAYPESGRQTDVNGIHYKIVKDYFLYYSFDTKHLYIVDICDMRRDPSFIRSLLNE